jgi:hypothetical protein
MSDGYTQRVARSNHRIEQTLWDIFGCRNARREKNPLL